MSPRRRVGIKSGRVITAATDDAPDNHGYRLPTQSLLRPTRSP
ncbi:hypothetical protein [Meiothermus taiwanensis]|nr:hypothetical protein [Meiothermus taiwanensis]